MHQRTPPMSRFLLLTTLLLAGAGSSFEVHAQKLQQRMADRYG